MHFQPKQFSQARRILTLSRSLNGLPLRRKLALVTSRASRWLRRKVCGLRGSCQRLGARIVGRLFGVQAEAAVFWFQRPAWADVVTRIAKSDARVRDALVAAGLRWAHDPMLLVGLAQREDTAEAMRHQVPPFNADPGASPEVRRIWTRSPDWIAAHVVIQMFLYDTAAAADAHAQLHAGNVAAYVAARDRLFQRPAGGVHTGYGRRARHRLVVLDSAKNPASWQHLLRNADTVTLIDVSDIYGKIDLGDVVPASTGGVHVEHVRSRLPRFSTTYHTLHAVTRAAAERLITACLSALDHPQATRARRHMELDLADKLFFEMLRLQALTKLIKDPIFDHIVIKAPADENSYALLLKCLPDAAPDMVSDTRIEQIALTPRPPIFSGSPPLSTPAFGALLMNARQHARHFRMPPVGPSGHRPHLLMLTTHNPAYDSSTAAYLKALLPDYRITTAFLGGSLDSMITEVPDLHPILRQIHPLTLTHRILPDMPGFRTWLCDRLLEPDLDDLPEDVRSLRDAFADQFVQTSLWPSLSEQALFSAMLDQFEESTLSPALALVVPQRNARLGLLAEEARAKGIPSLALEAHGLNGNYCRYAKVAMDYYGVISDYFLATADSAFGIPRERCRIVGSPRIIAPESFDPMHAQAQARDHLSMQTGIVFATGNAYVSFFCQPSDWTHVAKVWETILKATAPLGIHLLLKLHPEESNTRLVQYLNLAREHGAEKRVNIVDGDPKTIIDASDIVLTGYSAAALDAAIRQKPVVCVTADDQPYPIDQHIIVHSSLVSDADALCAEIERCLHSVGARQTNFMSAEPQFFEPPDARLRTFVGDILAQPTETALRPEAERPQCLFLDGPFREFPV